MADERDYRGRGYYGGREGRMDYARDYGSGRDHSYSSARDYAATGRDQDDDDGRRGYGDQRYGQREQFGGGQSSGRDYGYGDRGGRGYSQDSSRSQDRNYGGRDQYRGSYASDGRRFENVGRDRDWDDDDRRRGRQNGQQQHGYGRQPQGYNHEERGFFDRAGDEVRSWFGDDDAERRRDMDARYDERTGRTGRTDHDDHYHSWRSGQIASLDRDYDEYRRENRAKFENEFSSWRTTRQGQRDSLSKVKEHQEVVGSDGQHVGTVDKVRGDRIVLTKNDKDAGGQHHSIPCGWITSVDEKVVVNKTAEEAKRAWRDEERNSAMSGYGDNANSGDNERGDFSTDRNLNRSFSGTYEKK